MPEYILKNYNNKYIHASLIFIVSLILGLLRVLPWLDWGIQPEFVASAHGIAPGPGSASPLFILLARAAGALAGARGFVFSQNVFAAILLAVTASLVFLIGRSLGGRLLCGAAGWLVFMGGMLWTGLFDSSGPAPFIVFFTVLCVCGAERVTRHESPRAALPVFAFLCGIVAVQHPFLAAVYLTTLVILLRRDRISMRSPDTLIPLVFLFLAGMTTLMFLALRPRFSLITGVVWPGDILQAINIPPFDRFQDVYGKDIAQISPFYGFLLSSFLASPTAPFFPILALSLIGFVLIPEKRKSIVPSLLLFAVFAMLFYIPSPARPAQLYNSLLIACVAILFAAGAGEILAAAKNNNCITRHKQALPAISALIVIASLFPLTHNYSKVFNRGESKSWDYTALMLKSLRRDPLVFVNPDDDPLRLIPAASALSGFRPDAIAVFPDEFNDKEYRDSLRRRAGSGMDLPTEKEYNSLTTQTTEASKPKPYEGITLKESILKQRALYNLKMVAQNALSEQNAPIRPVYFNTIKRYVRTRSFNKMSFYPDRVLFYYRGDKLSDCIKSQLIIERDAGRIRDLPAGTDEGDKALDAKSAELEGLAMSCDSSEAGFSPSCLREKMIRANMFYDCVRMNTEIQPDGSPSVGDIPRKTMVNCLYQSAVPIPMEYQHADFGPTPKITEWCFNRQYSIDPAILSIHEKELSASGVGADAGAASLISTFYTDAGEYIYLHNSAPAKQSEWLFRIATHYNNRNSRAHFLLYLLYENSTLYDLASNEDDILFSLLREKEQAGNLDDYDYYMLEALYRKNMRPADAEKYRILLESETGEN